MYRIIHIATRATVAEVSTKPAQVAPGYRVVLVPSLATTTLAVGPL